MVCVAVQPEASPPDPTGYTFPRERGDGITENALRRLRKSPSGPVFLTRLGGPCPAMANYRTRRTTICRCPTPPSGVC